MSLPLGGYQALSADEPAGRGRGHRLIGCSGPDEGQSKSTSTKQPSKVTTKIERAKNRRHYLVSTYESADLNTFFLGGRASV